MPSKPTTRQRKLSGPVFVQSQLEVNPNFPLIKTETKSRGSFDGIQVTVSEGHQWPPRKGKLYDQGGPFQTSLSKLVTTSLPFGVYKSKSGWSTIQYTYQGPLICSPVAVLSDDSGNLGVPDLSSSDDDLDELGATAISRCEPTKSVSNLQTALAETLKEGLPSLIGVGSWKNRTDSLRKKGSSEYLNYQFGIAPLLSDISSVGKAAKNASSIVRQYERDEGNVVRRKYFFPLVTESSGPDPVDGALCPNINLFIGPRSFGSGQIFRIRQVTKKRWFAGAFTYYIDGGNDFFSKMHRQAQYADKLFGFSISPETLWNLTPWSWATDWFANTGDVIHNLEAFKVGNLILRYGYMMETTIIRDTYGWKYDSEYPDQPSVSPLIVERTIKKRRVANPFGFGVQWNDLSPFQLSITAALGLNKGRR